MGNLAHDQCFVFCLRKKCLIVALFCISATCAASPAQTCTRRRAHIVKRASQFMLSLLCCAKSTQDKVAVGYLYDRYFSMLGPRVLIGSSIIAAHPESCFLNQLNVCILQLSSHALTYVGDTCFQLRDFLTVSAAFCFCCLSLMNNRAASTWLIAQRTCC